MWNVTLVGKFIGTVNGLNFNEAYRAAEAKFGQPPFPQHYEVEFVK